VKAADSMGVTHVERWAFAPLAGLHKYHH
jgi:hypothetical protein